LTELNGIWIKPRLKFTWFKDELKKLDEHIKQNFLSQSILWETEWNKQL
jgi:hypothetical protein